jgi:putative endonuclease
VFARESGEGGERRAERFLRRQGLRTVSRNWHCRQGEIDLIMRDGETLVFVEVRLRTPHGFGDGADSVDAFKQQRLAQAASLYLARHRAWEDRPCRFDVVSIEGDTDTIGWIRDAFEADGW